MVFETPAAEGAWVYGVLRVNRDQAVVKALYMGLEIFGLAFQMLAHNSS